MVQISSSNASCHARHAPAQPAKRQASSQASGTCPFTDGFSPAAPQAAEQAAEQPRSAQPAVPVLRNLRSAWDAFTYQCTRTKKELVQWTRLLANSVVSIAEIALGNILAAQANPSRAIEMTAQNWQEPAPASASALESTGSSPT